MQNYDVLIIGGGVVGLTLGCMLAETKLRVAIVDQQPAPQAGLQSPYDSRVSAIHLASLAIFNSIGSWQSMRELRASAYQQMRVWDAGSPARIEFAGTEIGYPYLGYIVEHSVMRQALWTQLQKHKNLTFYHSTAPLALEEKPAALTVQLNDGEIIAGQLLVGADGSNSWVAKQVFRQPTIPTGQQYAIVATVRSEHPHQQTAWQRFLPAGPVAVLPLADPHLLSLVWSTSQVAAADLMALEETVFNQRLTQALEYALGKLTVCQSRRIFPLIQHQAPHYVSARVALVGDAAHSILPLAGQGLNLGLLDAACLAEVLVKALKQQRDFWELTSLRAYERWRRGENRAMMLAMAGFNNLFSNSLESARYLRYGGFAAVQKLPWIKRYFMARAMGLRGELPERAKTKNATLHLPQ